ncbi:MAG: hypothetical protein GY777_28600 [Candidatus Brocadiaceae bacterium]|nr:hypothetical protein [Candidatus Brocadiaceae bacterium]
MKEKKSSEFVQKTSKIHPDFLDIDHGQIFINYINNPPSQKHKNSKTYSDPGPAEEVSRLLADFKERMRIIKIFEHVASFVAINTTGIFLSTRAIGPHFIQCWTITSSAFPKKQLRIYFYQPYIGR